MRATALEQEELKRVIDIVTEVASLKAERDRLVNEVEWLRRCHTAPPISREDLETILEGAEEHAHYREEMAGDGVRKREQDMLKEAADIRAAIARLREKE